MQYTGVISNIGIDYKTRKAKISLVLDTKELDVIEQLKNENKLNIELKKYRQKRSLDANAYCWVLCDSIAKEMSLLIELIVELAKNLNIETKPQAEIDSLLRSWK